VLHGGNPLEFYVDNPDGRTVRIDPAHLSIHDLVSNEIMVAQVLYRMEQAFGWETMTRAFQASAGEDCRSLAEFLGALGRLVPGRRRAAALIIEDVFLIVDRPAIGTLVKGSIPAVGVFELVNTEVGRATPYVPSPVPQDEELEEVGAEIAATPEESGVLGM